MKNLYLISYISRATPEFHKHWPDILETALDMNPQHDITGVLFQHQGLILQVLEGEKAKVQQLMQNIRADKRHYEVEVLINEPIKKRSFSNWSMDSFDLPNDLKLEKETLVQIGRDFREIVKPRGDMFIKFYKAMLGIDVR